MSHSATTWAFSQRGLRPITKLILWALADAHNHETGRCDPSQKTLAAACEISRSTLNEHLTILEEEGLIRRRRRYDKASRGQWTTFYYLAFQGEFDAESDCDSTPQGTQDVVPPCPGNGQGGVSALPDRGCPPRRTGGVRPAGQGVSGLPDTNQESNLESNQYPLTPTKLSTLSTPADLIKSGKPFLCTQISRQTIRRCLAEGLVTIEQVTAAGLSV